MSARVGIVLQARCDSSRLPGKALAAIGGVTILKRCLDRLRLGAAGRVVLATTERPDDDALVVIARRMGIDVFRGSTSDVLHRYLQTAETCDFDIVIRATGDNPAVDIEAAGRLLDVMASTGADYACEDGLPYGAGVEIVTVAALARTASLTQRPGDREHVTTYIKRQPNIFRVTCAAAPRHLQRADLRLTIDTAADLAFMRRVFARLRPAEPSLTDIIAAADTCSRIDAA